MKPRALTFLLPLAAALATTSTAFATQPLEEFLAKAKTHSFDAREVEATFRQRDAEAEAALGRLLPAFSARGVYTHNQYEVAARLPGAPAPLVIQPQNQLDGFLTLDVPIVDLGSYYRYRGARAVARGATEQQAATLIDTSRNVCRAYYQHVAAAGLARSARQSVGAAESNLNNVELRRSAGLVTELDRERARANVERAKQDVADAELLLSLSARNLETLSGLTPSAVETYPEDGLTPEEPLPQWLARAGETPSERAAREASAAAAEQRKAANSALLPALTGTAQERFTNATGFSGRNATYLLQLSLNWRLDYTGIKTTEAQAAARDVAEIRKQRTQRAVADLVHDAYRRVEAGIVKSRAARAQATASARAAELAGDRYGAGAATQLDVTQAQRDAFLAEAARIQADADLSFARASLRLAAGADPLDRKTSR